MLEQDLWLPPSLRDWLLTDHPASCVSDVVDQLDPSPNRRLWDAEERADP